MRARAAASSCRVAAMSRSTSARVASVSGVPLSSEAGEPLIGHAAGLGHCPPRLLTGLLGGVGGRAQRVAFRVGAVGGAAG